MVTVQSPRQRFLRCGHPHLVYFVDWGTRTECLSVHTGFNKCQLLVIIESRNILHFQHLPHDPFSTTTYHKRDVFLLRDGAKCSQSSVAQLRSRMHIYNEIINPSTQPYSQSVAGKSPYAANIYSRLFITKYLETKM